jgi:hypothetical protein
MEMKEMYNVRSDKERSLERMGMVLIVDKV